MTEKDAHERRKIFKEELLALKNEKLIDETDYHRMVYAYNLYLQNMEKKNALNRIDSAEPQEDTKRISEKSEGQPQGHDPLKELIQKLKARQEQERKAAQLQAMNVNQVPPVSQTFATQPNAIPPETSMSPPARTINPGFKEPEKNMEQTRERNITWGLILGVILLFIGGLVFGTSQWSSMNNLLKVVMVSLVSVVFFVISFLAERYFKIAKTAFAFLTLGSLFLPISLISIAFFGLLGPYFSVYGEGRYFFGFISSSICLALYMYIAAKYRHRLFVWFSFLTATIATSFLLAMTRLPNDFFYFGLMLYNALLLFVYYKWRRQEKGAIFTKELPLYAQLNLIVSTLLLLFFYENEVFYSFNILLTAALYISMVYINKAKHYHFVFTLLLVYGMYQLIEHSILQSLDYIGFAFIGMLYLLLQKLTTDEHHLGKMFRITSGIISFCAFIFISIQGLLLRSDKDSFVLLAAYLIIAVNYLVLANMTKFSLFRYLAPIFLLTAVWQSYYVLLPGLHGQWLDLYLFAFATAMFALLYVKNEHHYFIVIRRSSFIVSILSMLLSIFLSFANGAFTHMALLLFSFGLISLITYDHTGHVLLQKAAAWGNPISWGLAFLSLFADLKKNVPMYALNAEMMGHCAIGGLLLLAVSLIWKKKRDNSLEVNTFLSGTALYTLGLLFTPFQGHEHPYFTSVIYFVGIAVYVWLVYKRKKPMLWILVSMTSLAFLLSLVHLFEPTLDSQWLTLYNLTIPIMLLAVYEYMG